MKSGKRVTNQKVAFQRGRNDARRNIGRGQVPYSDARMAESWERGYDYQKKEARKVS